MSAPRPTSPAGTAHRRGFLEELKDAVAPRTVGLILGVLALQLAFVASYIGAFHSPTPHELAFGVVAPTEQAQQLTATLNGLSGDPLDARVVADRDEAAAQVESGTLAGALVVDPTGSRDELLVASGGGSSIVTAVEGVTQQVQEKQGRSFATTDLVPLQSGDARGLTGFYLVLGWIVGGYLVAALLGVAKGSRPANTRRAVIRLLATVPYAVVSGLGGALIVDPWFGALTGHFLALWGIGTLLVLSSATVTMALQVLFGTIGIGLTVLLFVVLGNPSAGGAYQRPLIPELWRVIGDFLPNGAGTEAVRRVVYFGGHDVAAHLVVIAAYVVVGVVLTLLASLRHSRGAAHTSSARHDPVDRGAQQTQRP